MKNYSSKTDKAQSSMWVTQNCGKPMLFAEVVARGVERSHLMPALAREYQARNAKLAARQQNLNSAGGEL